MGGREGAERTAAYWEKKARLFLCNQVKIIPIQQLINYYQNYAIPNIQMSE